MSNSVVSLLPIEGPAEGQVIILCSEWQEDHIKLRLFTPWELTRSLDGSVLLTDLVRRAEEFEIPAAEFVAETRLCLSTNNGLEGFRYVYSAEDQEFTWKKRTTGTLTLLYGTARLTPSAGSPSDGLVGILTTLQTDNRSLAEENSRLRKDNRTLKLCHEELIKAHTATETALLSKCRLLINAKKTKIRELEEKWEQKIGEEPPVAEDSETPIVGRKRNTTNRIFSESSQPADSSDDSIPLAFLPKRKDMVAKSSSSSSSKEKVPTSRSDSANLENDSQDLQGAGLGQDSQDCNGIFDYL